MDAQRLSGGDSGGGDTVLLKAQELPFSLRLKPEDRRRLRSAVWHRFGHLIPDGVDPIYEIDKMIDSQGPVTEQNLIKLAVDRKWAS
ncbi:MAG: hypothetical protein GVY22_10355 [Gammaproteobacteria bacterium]|nr:hypothetical protein [Gammaproteobacteria bacterium]